MLRLFRRQELGARRFRRAAQSAEEVQLKCCVCRERQKVERCLEVLLFSSVEIGVPRYLGEQTGTRDGKLGALGVDALRRQLQVVVLLQSRADQLLQLRVLKDLPPRKIRKGSCLSLDLRVFAQVAVRRRSLNVGPMVVRADRASSRLNSKRLWRKCTALVSSWAIPLFILPYRARCSPSQSPGAGAGDAGNAPVAGSFPAPDHFSTKIKNRRHEERFRSSWRPSSRR